MKLIETALSHDSELVEGNMELNLWIRGRERAVVVVDQKTGEVQTVTVESAESRRFEISRQAQIRRTSDALSQELLYLKFVQGLPVVGVVGGLSDMVYQKKISDYAALKYKRRFLEMHRGASTS